MTENLVDDNPRPNVHPTLRLSALAHWASTHRVLIGLIVLSLLLRIATAFVLGDHANVISGAADQYSYDTLAQRVLQGEGFSFPTAWYPFTQANEPTAHWSFLYTLFLSAVYLIFGHHPLLARLIQILLSSLSVWLAYRIGARLFNERAGLAAATLTAVYAYFIFYNAALMTQTFYILALLGAIDVALELVRNPTRRRWILLGLCLGLGALLRQTLILFTPILLAWVAWTLGHRLRKRDILLPVMVIALLVLPWTVRNYFAYHDFLLLNSNGGYWFYASNHPNQGTTFDANYEAPLPAKLRGQSEAALDRALYGEAVGFVVSDPQRFLLLTWSRLPAYFWLAPSEESSLPSNVARLFSFTLYFPFMLYGVLLSRQKWRVCLPLYAYIGFETTLHLISWAAPRYRLPSDALMMVFAGLAVVSLVERFGLRPKSLLYRRLAERTAK